MLVGSGCVVDKEEGSNGGMIEEESNGGMIEESNGEVVEKEEGE